MISINSYPNISNIQLKKASKPSFSAVDVSDIIVKGDIALNENRLEEALNSYSQALNKNPQETILYRKLGKTYSQMKDFSSAEKSFVEYLKTDESESEVWIDLGETQRQQGKYQAAIQSFNKALSIEPNNDFAKRSLMLTKNNMLAIFSPEQAKKEKNDHATKNLQEALKMTVDYLTPAFMQDMTDINICFGETASMGGTSNIAQYENYKKTITVSDSYIYASPQVIAAYLTHESIHAKDKDAYTSVREEQDAYEIATKFWIKNSNGVQDPEMDYAAQLYKQSPEQLQARVKEIYELRDPSISQTSPNHPPEKKVHFNFFKKKTAQQPLTTYDIIA